MRKTAGRKIIILMVIILAVWTCYLAVSTYAHTKNSISGAYDANWGINYGRDLKEIYYKEDDHGWHGDGDRFSILYSDEDFRLPQKNLSGSGENCLDKSANRKFIRKIYQTLSVPMKYRMKNDANTWHVYSRNHGFDRLLVVHDRSGLVYIFEELI